MSSARVFGISPERVYQIVTETSTRFGRPLAPHDIRRTFARLSRKGGASIEQIQQTLGHSSIQTTERYLGSALELELGKAAGDQIKLQIERKTE